MPSSAFYWPVTAGKRRAGLTQRHSQGRAKDNLALPAVERRHSGRDCRNPATTVV